jgi:hypothetical protein
MPRKRKAKEPAITVKAAPPPVEPLITQIPITCVWDSRLIVSADKTPSGTRYEFNTGQTKPVLETDYQLLDMRAKAPGCCGGAGGSPMQYQKYFVVAD